jgi:Flp pilus assembly protein TadG
VTSSRLRGDRGSGVVSSLAGVAAFLAFLLLAVHVILGLYATSLVSDAAADAARRVAGTSLTTDPTATAEAQVRKALGRLGEGASVRVTIGDDSVGVTVRVARPGFTRAFGEGVIERTVRVRREAPR